MKKESEKGKHPDKVAGYEGSFEELAQAIGKMSYDKVADFINELAKELGRQGDADSKRQSITNPAKTRTLLAKHLILASENLLAAKKQIDRAWRICQPYM